MIIYCIHETEKLSFSHISQDGGHSSIFFRLANFSCFQNFQRVLNIVHIWRVSTQLSCGDTRQIWMWSKYFTRLVQNLTNGWINEALVTHIHKYLTIIAKRH